MTQNHSQREVIVTWWWRRWMCGKESVWCPHQLSRGKKTQPCRVWLWWLS